MYTLGLDIGGSSIKAALIHADTAVVAWEARTPTYINPSADILTSALRDLLTSTPSTQQITAIGLCVPGLLNSDRTAIEKSVNLPGLVGLPLQSLVRAALPRAADGTATFRLTLASDAHAAAVDAWRAQTPAPIGRLLCLSLGTGVGACVLDDGVPLHVSSTSPGHVGQLDVSFDDNPPVGPDGGRGSLEAFIGLPALIARYGNAPERTLASLTPDAPPLRALARALRICHAIYRPHHIRLLGGVGIRLAHLLPALRESVAHQLTSVARPGWTLEAGHTDFHAARGAARLAASSLA